MKGLLSLLGVIRHTPDPRQRRPSLPTITTVSETTEKREPEIFQTLHQSTGQQVLLMEHASCHIRDLFSSFGLSPKGGMHSVPGVHEIHLRASECLTSSPLCP